MIPKNKRGNVFLGVTIGIFVFVMGALFLPYVVDSVTSTQNELNCDQPNNITSGDKLTCLVTDGTVPYFIWFFSSVAIGYFSARGL